MGARDDCLATLALTVHALRLGRQAEAATRVVELVDCLARRLVHPAPRGIDEIARALSAVVAAQERGDPLGLADLFEYEIGPRLLELR